MEYKDDLIADFAARTLRNLDVVQDRVRSGDEALYDVTQLWNSLLGLIVLPLETDENRIPPIEMADLESQGWPRLSAEARAGESLHVLVKNLRNAVAHANVTFVAGADRQIESVRMWNEYPPGNVRWTGQATVEELDRFVRLIATLYRESFVSPAK